MIYNIMFISAIEEDDAVICLYSSSCSFYDGWPQGTKYSFLSSAVEPCLCILNLLVWASTSGEPTCQCRVRKTCGFHPWVGKTAWRRAWQPTPVFLPGESQGQRSVAGYSPWGCKESDMTEVTWQASWGGEGFAAGI